MRGLLTNVVRTLVTLLLRDPACRRNILAGITGLLLGSASGYALILWSNRNAPVIVHDEHSVGAATLRSGHIDIFIDLDRMRDCPAETSRWLWTWVTHEGRQIKQFYPLASSATSLSDPGRDQRLILSLPIPAGVQPGRWFFWSKTIEHCSLFPSLFRSPIRESADIPISIVADPG